MTTFPPESPCPKCGTDLTLSGSDQADTNEAFVMVPREPTDKMASAGETALMCGPRQADLDSSPGATWAVAKTCWREMYDAAPVHRGQTPVAWLVVGKEHRRLQLSPDVADDDAPLVTVIPLVPAVADMVSPPLRAQVRAVIEYEMGFFTPTGVQAARCILHKLDEKVFARAALTPLDEARAALGDST